MHSSRRGNFTTSFVSGCENQEGSRSMTEIQILCPFCDKPFSNKEQAILHGIKHHPHKPIAAELDAKYPDAPKEPVIFTVVNEICERQRQKEKQEPARIKQEKKKKEGSEDPKPKRRVMKYSNGVLWESVTIAGMPEFVSCSNGVLEVVERLEESTRILMPFTETEPQPYAFASVDDLLKYVDRAKHENLDSLWAKVRPTVAAFNATDNRYIDMLTADIIFSYFADRIGMCHYLWPNGRPGTGKGSMLETAHQLAYRAVLVSNTTAANVYRLLGPIQPGQCSLLIDELNHLDDDPFLTEVLKTGYKSNGRVPRIMDASSADAQQVFYYTYSWKMIASEKPPPEWLFEGLLSRCFLLKTYPAEPKYKIDKVVNPAGDPLLHELHAQLDKLRKILFAYRLVHWNDPILDLKLNIDGRDEELCSPLVRLFRGSKILDEIIMPTLHEFVKEKRDANTLTLEKKILDAVRDIIAAQPLDVKNLTMDFSAIWAVVEPMSEFEVSQKAVSQILVKFGAKRGKNKEGRTTMTFDPMRLEQFARSYLVPDRLEIIAGAGGSGGSGGLWQDIEDSDQQNNVNIASSDTDISSNNPTK